MPDKLKRVFTVNVLEENDGKYKVVEKEYAVIVPSLKVQLEANKVRSQTFNRLLKDGVMLREELEKILKERNIWDDEKQAEFNLLKAEVLKGEFALSQGGIKLKEARDIAIQMRDYREKMIALLSKRTDLDSQTCEGQADQERFNFLFANCLVYNDDSNTLYFKNGLAEYLENTDDPVAAKGASEFYYLISDSGPVDSTLPENVFLKDYDFIDDNLRLVDPTTKRLVNEAGHYIDEFGNLIKYKEDGSYYYVDINGNEVDIQTGTYVDTNKKPFLDDDGNPVVKDDEVKVEKKRAPRKRRAKKTETVDTDA